MIGDAVDRPPAIRASDAERDGVVRELEREFAAGRLTMAELEQRVAAAHAARTREQLWALTVDLPFELVQARTVAAGPDHFLMCLLWCVCPPAGLMYSLISRHAVGLQTPN